MDLDSWSNIPKLCHKICAAHEKVLFRDMIKSNMGVMVSACDILQVLYLTADVLRRARRRAKRRDFDITLAGGWFAVMHASTPKSTYL